MRTAALALWSTVMAVGCAGAAVVLVGSSGTGSASPVQAIDPGAPTRLANSSPPPPEVSRPATPPKRSATPPKSSATPPKSSATPPKSSATPPRSSQASSAATPSKTGAVAGAQVGPPVEVRIASVGIAAAVQAVGVDDRGYVVIPERVDTVGWYRFSAAPGSAAGSTVLVGHVDSAREEEGAFFRLRDVGRGDRVVLELAGGRRLAYQVISRVQFPKDTVPLAELFGRDGRPRLTLITCGGSFDDGVGSYRDNIVITAVPQ